MYNVCMNCYEIYKDTKFTQCPKVTCVGDVIDIDELMIPAIIILNKKGYKTKMCCSTHEFGITLSPEMMGYKNRNIWVHFSQDMLSVPSVPEGFSLCHLASGNKDDRHVVRIEQNPSNNSNTSVIERQSRMFSGIISLTKWAEELPERLTKNTITFQDVYNAIQDYQNNDDFVEISKNSKIKFLSQHGYSSRNVILIHHLETLIMKLMFKYESTDVLSGLCIEFFKDGNHTETYHRLMNHPIGKIRHSMNNKEDINHIDLSIAILTELVNNHKK